MNSLEKNLVKILNDLKTNHGVIGVKAEFEAEGTRLEECIRLKEIVSAAGLGLTLKIGGCEAIRDMYDARIIGVEKIVAPMIETPFSLKKFTESFLKVFSDDERANTKFVINIETDTAYKLIDDILGSDDSRYIDGIVFGRNDMSYSMGLGREGINTVRVMEASREVLTRARRKGMTCGIGGGVSATSVPLFRQYLESCLDYYETRKVMFDFARAADKDFESGILKALNFEILWLKNKRDFYKVIFEEDIHRIQTLETRYRASMKARGI